MNADPESRDAVTGVILAGGEARRMGGRDKGLIEIAGRPMVEYVIEALRPQVGALLINANRSRERYARFGYPVVADEFDGYNGPLAGMASCMRVAATDYIATLPCDSPNIPPDLVARLFLRLREEQADIGVAHNGERMQPVFSLIRCALLDSLLDYLNGGERKIDRWFERHATAVVDFSDRPDTFINVNTPEDVAKMEATLTHA
ncbi:MAG: molybdenum cofactor guanylyltransferase MobA [Gammaproteobacteria bacterium]